MTVRVPSSRGEAAARLLDVLTAACSAGEACLIGSMASPGRADTFSDIDIRWTIPPAQAPGQLRKLRGILQRIGTVESLRVDPDARADMCLVFVRFEGWPLWWRVDLEIHSGGMGPTDVAESDPWSPHESACMGVVVTLKALARNQPETAEVLFDRALQRVGATDVAGDWRRRTDSLLDRIETTSPDTADLVCRARRLSREVFEDYG